MKQNAELPVSLNHALAMKNILDSYFDGFAPNIFAPFRDKTILVTGATGLIGSLICKALLFANENYETHCTLIAVARDKRKLSRILEGYATDDCLEVVECDLSKGEPEVEHVDYILHAAAVTKSKVMIEHPVDVAMTSLRGTEALLELARKAGARMVYISSMEVYGTLAPDEVADETRLGWIDLAAVRSCYPESKRMCECLCSAYAAQYEVKVCSARLAQTFGAGVLAGENRAFAQFVRSAMNGDDIILKTRGLSEGNYVNTIDCVAGLLTLLVRGDSGQAYNVANESSHGTIREVAETASEAYGGLSDVVIDLDESNASGYAPDVHLRLSSAKLRGLGWKPLYSLVDSFIQLGDWI